jgi:hypothetical protein
MQVSTTLNLKTIDFYSFNARSISSPVHSVLVNDGSLCGDSSFCQNNTCIQQKSKESCDSQKTCSGNGVSISCCSDYLIYHWDFDRFVQPWVYVTVIHHGKEKIVQYMIWNMKRPVILIVHYRLHQVCYSTHFHL